MTGEIRVTPQIVLDEEELVERFIRASGPGGQNVNKVSTAVELRFNAMASPNLPPRVKRRLGRIAMRCGRGLGADTPRLAGVLDNRSDRRRDCPVHRRTLEGRETTLAARYEASNEVIRALALVRGGFCSRAVGATTVVRRLVLAAATLHSHDRRK